MNRLSYMTSMFAAVLSVAAAAQPVVPGSRSLPVAARFVDTTVGTWQMRAHPELLETPTLADLAAAGSQGAADDFGLSFNCTVKRSGAVRDCRPIYATPDTADKAALTRVLARHVRLSRTDAALARAKAYRVTIDVALNTAGPSGMPRQCLPPFCMIEGAMPPPPPPLVQDPVVADVFDRAERCFSTAWTQSRDLRFAAEKALRDRAEGPATDADRQRVLRYVSSRQALLGCAAELRTAVRVLPVSASDQKTVTSALKTMRTSYDGQTRYELIILIGLLDPAAGIAEAALPQ